jgi:predicted flavoprotein YhiN
VSQFNPHTLESKHHSGLFACGELLDVDGGCGGFSLHWAWASGRLAARSAMQYKLKPDPTKQDYASA